jgi:hypothetical protein
MRIRSLVIVLGAAIALGGLSAYAANSHGSAVSSFARTTTLQGALRGDAVSDLASVRGATSSTTFRTGTPKSKDEAKESPACEAAEDALTALRSADRAEDQTEHGATGATTTKTADRAEDQMERATAEAARDAVQAACRPARTAACTAAIDALRALLTADRTEDTAEARPTTDAARAADRIEDAAEKQARKSAVQAVVAACADRR